MILAETSIQLVPDATLLFHLVLVVVMVVVLNRTLLKPINQILSERERLITGHLREAEALAAESLEAQEVQRRFARGAYGWLQTPRKRAR